MTREDDCLARFSSAEDLPVASYLGLPYHKLSSNAALVTLVLHGLYLDAISQGSSMTEYLTQMASIASELKYTPLDTIPALAAGVRNAFNSHKTKPIDFRLMQLRKLYWGYALGF